METSKQYYRVDRRRISFIKFVFEAYEGVAVVTTIDAPKGLIRLAVAPGCESVARGVMDDLGRSILIEPAQSDDPSLHEPSPGQLSEKPIVNKEVS